MSYMPVENLELKTDRARNKNKIQWLIYAIVATLAIFSCSAFLYGSYYMDLYEDVDAESLIIPESASELRVDESIVQIHTIPKIIHFTGAAKSPDNLNVDEKEYMESWRKQNPDHKIIYYNDQESAEFVSENFPQYYNLYMRLPIAILRADLFRYMVLYKHGGVYTDTDTTCLRPISTWNHGLKNIEFITGLEADVCYYEPCLEDWQHKFPRAIQLLQWTIASRPGHPILGNLIQKIASRSSKYMSDSLPQAYNDIMNWTGPGIYTDVVIDYLGIKPKQLSRMEKPKQFDTVLILPLTGFEPEAHPEMGSKSVYNEESMVEHHFEGTWKESGKEDDSSE